MGRKIVIYDNKFVNTNKYIICDLRNKYSLKNLHHNSNVLNLNFVTNKESKICIFSDNNKAKHCLETIKDYNLFDMKILECNEGDLDYLLYNVYSLEVDFIE